MGVRSVRTFFIEIAKLEQEEEAIPHQRDSLGIGKWSRPAVYAKRQLFVCKYSMQPLCSVHAEFMLGACSICV